MAQRGQAAPQPVNENAPGKPAPASAGRTSGWGATFLILCAICIAGVIPVYLAGQLLGLWHVPIPSALPFPLPYPFPTPAATLTP